MDLIQIFAGYMGEDHIYQLTTFSMETWVTLRSELEEYPDSITYSTLVF